MTSEDAIKNTVKKVIDEALQEFMSEISQVCADSREKITIAEQQTSNEVNKILLEKDQQTDTIRRQIIGRAEIQSRNKSLQIVEDAVNQTFNKALSQLSSKSSKESEIILKKLLSESVEAVGGKNLTTSCKKEHRSILSKISKSVEKTKKVKITIESKPIDCVGGLITKSMDRSIIYDNTYEARLERIRSTLRKEIASVFSKGRSS